MDLSQETPKENEWVYCEEFEKQLFDPEAKLLEVKPITQGP